MTPRTRPAALLATRGLRAPRRTEHRPERLGATERPGATTVTPTPGGNLVIARTTDSFTMDNTAAFDNESIWVFQQLMETLYTVTPDGKSVKPWLATSYDLSPDKLTYTFHLRKGVKFHTGQEMTADDVKFSIDAARNPKTGWGYIDVAIKSVTVKDKYTVVIKTKYPWAPLVADIALFNNAILPKNYGGKTKKAFYDAPVGTGPFKWDHWTKGKEIKYVKFNDLLAEGQAVPGQRDVDVRARRQHAPPAAQGRAGADRRVPGLGAGQAAEVDGRRHDDAVPVDAHRLRALQPALQAVPGRPRAPRALVPDRPQGARQGDPVRQRHRWPTRSCRRRCPYYDAKTPGLQYNVAKAKAELAKSTVPKGFTATFEVTSGVLEQQTIAQVLQAAAKPLGIKVNILKKDGNAWQADWQAAKYPGIDPLVLDDGHRRPGRARVVRGRSRRRARTRSRRSTTTPS